MAWKCGNAARWTRTGLLLLFLTAGCGSSRTLPWEETIHVSGAYPGSGPVAGGTEVTVFGIAFEEGATVEFDGTPALNVSRVDGCRLACTTPSHLAASVAVTVRNPGGASATRQDAFLYLGDPPQLSGLAPSSGPPAGGTLITLTGTNLQPGATVAVGGHACTAYDYTSTPSQVSCETTAGDEGVHDVVLTNPDSQAATLANAFTYDPSQGGVLLAEAGPNTPPARTCWNFAPKKEILQLRLSASAHESLRIDSLAFAHAGTGTPSTEVTHAALFLDSNGNGVYETGVDPAIGSAQAFSGASVTFSSLNGAMTDHPRWKSLRRSSWLPSRGMRMSSLPCRKSCRAASKHTSSRKVSSGTYHEGTRHQAQRKSPGIHHAFLPRYVTVFFRGRTTRQSSAPLADALRRWDAASSPGSGGRVRILRNSPMSFMSARSSRPRASPSRGRVHEVSSPPLFTTARSSCRSTDTASLCG